MIVEGAGSPAEINLRDRDIANMGFAEAVDCPVVLVADIDRGGVFAHIVGTLSCLSESERNGSSASSSTASAAISACSNRAWTGWKHRPASRCWPCCPICMGLFLDAEDAVQPVQASAGAFRIVVPSLPRMSNHTDFDALRVHPDVDLQFMRQGEAMPPCDLMIIPGSKNTRGDLAWLRAMGWDQYLARHLRYGGKVIGICGGFQMLGKSVSDPHGVEGAPASRRPRPARHDTEMTQEKRLAQVSGHCAFADASVAGYEIHMGVSTAMRWRSRRFLSRAAPRARCSADGQVLGSYLHGMFDTPQACSALLRWAGLSSEVSVDTAQLREASLDRIAEAALPLYQALCEIGAGKRE
jgi:adenosylcobyric acid synthase